MLFQWSVFSCGHCICCQCAWVLLRQAGVGPRHRNVHVKCPMCRVPTIAQEISYVSTARTQTEQVDENVSVKVLAPSVNSPYLLLCFALHLGWESKLVHQSIFQFIISFCSLDLRGPKKSWSFMKLKDSMLKPLVGRPLSHRIILFLF